MSQSVKLIGITKQITQNELPELKVREEMQIFAGKAAGICYMPDDYFSKAFDDDEKSINRSKRNAVNGHYSVYEHGHINLIIKTSKIMAMILNSLNLYATSEKSGRYTAMKPETELEQEMYAKWKNVFVELITPFYEKYLTEKEIDKLAMENARYMISVFTPTVMEYTIPYNRAILTCGWLYELADTIETFVDEHPKVLPKISKYDYFYDRVKDECNELADLISGQIGITKNDHILDDHKKIGIEFFRTFGALYKANMNGKESVDMLSKFKFDNDNINEYFGDVYTSRYKASFAELAQGERHRTLHYSMELPERLNPYIPKIIRGSAYEVEWTRDFDNLISNKIIPQGTLVDIVEQGRFVDFVLKCKERLCSRAQLEIMEITRDQLTRFTHYTGNLSYANRALLEGMIIRPKNGNGDFVVKSRCNFPGYKCKEPCKVVNTNINYYRNA